MHIHQLRRREFITLLGGAAAWPLAARAQQPTMHVIGYLSGATESVGARMVPAFRQGLRQEGYVEGRNVEILFRWFEGQYDRLPALAADLVGRRVDAIFTFGETIALTTKTATSTIPIVFAFGGDPVAIGLVPSLNRPGGNVTGATSLAKELAAKQLELLHETVPAVTAIGYLVRPDDSPYTPTTIKEVETAARILGVRLIVVKASTPSEIEAAFATLVRERIGALIVADFRLS
jgi:putative ABC transport system substrate-binding protein